MFCPSDFSKFPWLRPAWEAHSQGVSEVRGRQDNPEIVQYLESVGLSGAHDETAWCSAFVNWCMGQAGLVGTGKGNARSWLHWDQGIALDSPLYGAVTVLWRVKRSGWQGHVGFYMETRGSTIYLLGGNQGNAVSIRGYDEGRLLGYLWPRAYAVCSAP